MDGQMGGRAVDSINPMLMQMLMSKLQGQQMGAGRMPGAGGMIPQAPMPRGPLPQVPGGQPQGLLSGASGGMNPMQLAMMMQRLKGAQPPASPGQSVPENFQRVGQQFSGALPQPDFASKFQLPPDFNWMPGSGGF